ncbi:UNVERIFIED_CONTAM: hypothetical protein RMT77_015916 [Armadillidium vulgare]
MNFLNGFSSFGNLIKKRIMSTIVNPKRQCSRNKDIPKKRVMVLESEIKAESSLEPPTNCCMSGCPNCVWLEYADTLRAHYIEGNKVEETLKEVIEREVDDPSLKAYLLFELRLSGKL